MKSQNPTDKGNRFNYAARVPEAIRTAAGPPAPPEFAATKTANENKRRCIPELVPEDHAPSPPEFIFNDSDAYYQRVLAKKCGKTAPSKWRYSLDTRTAMNDDSSIGTYGDETSTMASTKFDFVYEGGETVCGVSPSYRPKGGREYERRPEVDVESQEVVSESSSSEQSEESTRPVSEESQSHQSANSTEVKPPPKLSQKEVIAVFVLFIAILLVIIIALSTKIARNGRGTDTVLFPKSDNVTSNSTFMDIFQNVTDTMNSFAPDIEENEEPATLPCLKIKYDKPIFSNKCIGCNFQIAIDGKNSIVSSDQDNSVHFFTFVNDSWSELNQSLQVFSTNATIKPVAIDGVVAIAGDPHETETSNSGVAIVFEMDKSTGEWNKVEVLEEGWDDSDLEERAGIVNEFGQTVAVHADVIAVGATDEGNVNPTFFFRRRVHGWGREEIFPTASEKYQSVIKVAVRNDLALTALASPRYQSDFNSFVYLFRSNPISQTFMRFEKIADEDCAQFGEEAAIFDDGGVVISCEMKDKSGMTIQYYNISSDGEGYEFQQEIYIGDVVNGKKGWLAIDKNTNTLAYVGTPSSDERISIHVLAHANGNWREVGKISHPEKSMFTGSIAISENQILLGAEDNVHAYTFNLEAADRC